LVAKAATNLRLLVRAEGGHTDEAGSQRRGSTTARFEPPRLAPGAVVRVSYNLSSPERAEFLDTGRLATRVRVHVPIRKHHDHLAGVIDAQRL